ncbi:MAG: hypothetical protein N2C14_01310, partial [Planctomycetales bacterium]
WNNLDLTKPVARWLQGQHAAHGATLTRLTEQVETLAGSFRPDVLVLDEDCSALQRAAVAAGRRLHARSAVIQHGAPCLPHGFVPLAADRIFAWGETSRKGMIQWGETPDRIRVTGSPKHDSLWSVARRGRRAGFRREQPRVLLLATRPPVKGRPDSVEFHLTDATYDAMVHTAFSAAAALPVGELIVKVHPRANDKAMYEAVARRFPGMRCKVIHGGDVVDWFLRCDAVISCASSAGIEAAMFHLPTVQLLPQGAGDILPAHEWGMSASARDEDELVEALRASLQGTAPRESRLDATFANRRRPAALQIADALCETITEQAEHPVGFRLLNETVPRVAAGVD